MTSGTFPGQRKFPVSLFRGSHRSSSGEQGFRPRGTDFPARGLETQSGAGVVRQGWGAAKRLASPSVPNFKWGALAWLGVKEGSLQFMGFAGGLERQASRGWETQKPE